jgi:hypothetical protein
VSSPSNTAATTVPTVNVSATALRFFFKVTLKRRDLADAVVSVREPRRLPVVLSPEEVGRLLASATNKSLSTPQKLDLWSKVRPEFNAPAGSKSSSAPLPYPHTIVTPHLGLQFRQDNEIVPITGTLEDTGLAIRLKRAPFEIMLPVKLTQDIEKEVIALGIAISADPALFQLVSAHFDSSDDSFLVPAASGMADYDYGSGTLSAVELDYDHPNMARFLPFNYLIGGRFNVEFEGRRGVYVSSLPSIYKGLERYDGPDMLRSAPAAYMVCHLYRSRQDRVGALLDPLSVEMIRINFVD